MSHSLIVGSTIRCLLFSVEWESGRLLSAEVKRQEAVVACFKVIFWTLETVVCLLYDYCIGHYPLYGVCLKHTTVRKLGPFPCSVGKGKELHSIGISLDHWTPDIESGFLQRDQLSKILSFTLPTYDGNWSFYRNGYFKCISRIG
jgi:hypothetical protein